MKRDKSYYQNLLYQLEYTLLEFAGELLQTEMAIYEIRKLLLRMREIDEQNNPRLNNLKLSLEQLRNKHEVLVNDIEDLELDVSHARFMIDILSPDEDDE